jgi:hypothetical protein
MATGAKFMQFFYSANGASNEAEIHLETAMSAFYNRPGVHTRLENIVHVLYPEGLRSKLVSHPFSILLDFTNLRSTPSSGEAGTSLVNTTLTLTDLYQKLDQQPDWFRENGLNINQKYMKIQLGKLIGDLKQIVDQAEDSKLKAIVANRIAKVWQPPPPLRR